MGVAIGYDTTSPNEWYNSSAAQDRIKAFIDKAVHELGDHNNVIWEIQNEPQIPQPSPDDTKGYAWFDTMRSQIQTSELVVGHQAHMIMPYDSPGHRDVGGNRTPGKPEGNEDSDYQQAHQVMVGNYDQYQTVTENTSRRRFDSQGDGGDDLRCSGRNLTETERRGSRFLSPEWSTQ
ncbi:MAG: hypothetical protein AAF657_24035 [Acidobacteriota bacterium]